MSRRRRSEGSPADGSGGIVGEAVNDGSEAGVEAADTEEEQDAEEADAEEAEPHAQILALLSLPLFDDLFLSMQARNLALVDSHLREVEQAFLEEWMNDGRLPLPTAMLVGALSQMWVFAAYELLRTWRERAQYLVKYGTVLLATKSAEKRAREVERRKSQRGSVPEGNISALIHEHQISSLEERPDQQMPLLTGAMERVNPVFDVFELVRITLAKHQIPKGGPAVAPGYTRFADNGAAMWIVEDRHGERFVVNRHVLVTALGSVAPSDRTRTGSRT